MQQDTNGDLHPCTYFSKTFSPAECNYDIYDCELLAVILALAEWKHYLQGTPHPISIITDHKNLSYIKDPQKLSRRQAHWSLFLQDFHIKWVITPGSQMGPADALSCKDDIDTSTDNHSSILPDPVIVNTLDLTLFQAIAKSSSSDPLVLRVLSALQDGSPLFSHSSTANWTFDNRHLYFKGRMYIPPLSRSSLLHALHSSPTTSHMGIFHTKVLLEHNYWWPGLSSFIKHFIDGCAICQQNKVNTHPTTPPLSPIPSSSPLPFKQLSVDLITDLPLSDGHDSIVVIVDHGLTKGVILTPCSKTIDAMGIAQVFLDHMFK